MARLPMLTQAARDVERVEKHALILISVDRHGNVHVTRRRKSRLTIIGVVGYTTELDSTKPTKAVLAEIGLWRRWPYQPVSNNGCGSKIQPRKKLASLTQKQYECIAPYLFSEIKSWVEKRANNRIPSARLYWNAIDKIEYTNRYGETIRKQRRVSISRGYRITVPLEFTYLIADLCWAELRKNIEVMLYLSKFAQWVRFRIKKYENGYKRDFKTLKGFKLLKRLLLNSILPWHLQVEALTYLPGGKAYPLYQEICELMHWDGSATRERTLAQHALPNPQSRLKNLQVRTKKMWNGSLAFEIYPEHEEEIPF